MDNPVFSATKTAITVALLLSTFVCLANDGSINLDADIKRVVDQRSQEIIELSESRDVIEAVKSQNMQKLSAKEVERRDQLWQEAKQDDGAQLAMLDTNIQQTIRNFVLNKKVVYSEMILIGEDGVNIASYPLSSDYFQGDEEKYTRPYESGEIFYGPVEYDESSGVPAIQISVPVKDGSTVIGVLVAGVKLSYAKARSHGYR
ncbi:MAG: PDC sensor domain-containing protein [Gammaproteobacteria bacterium]|nr:PDC sensor domain-containing protein [Gammaproteobacteria bacterium]